MNVFRSRMGSAVYLTAVLLTLVGLVLLATQPSAWCNAPRGTPGVMCRDASGGHRVGFALAGVGWAALLVTAKVLSGRVAGNRWTALFACCFGLLIPDAVRTLLGASERT